MGVYENLLKKKIINENTDGSVSINHQELDNVINNKPTDTWQQTFVQNIIKPVSDVSNSLNDKINQTMNNQIRTLPSFLQDTVEPIYKQAQNLSLEQKMKYANDKTNQIANEISKKLSRPLWEQIQDFANDTGRTIENTWLGAKHGLEDSSNYIDSMLNGEKTQKEKEMQRILLSNLSDEEKRMYIAQNSPLALLLNEDSSEKMAETINSGLHINLIDANTIEKVRNEYKSLFPIDLNDENLNTMRQYFKDNYDKEKIEKIATTDVKEEERKKENEKIAQNIEQQTNPVAKKLAELAPSVGQMVPGIGLSTINPGLGAGYFVTSAGGSYLQDAKARGMDETQSKIYATAMGIMEGLTEKISVGNLKKAGKAMKTVIAGTSKEIAKEGAKQVATNSIKEALKSYGIGIAENTVQELIMEPIQETMAGLIGGEDKANWENMPQRMLDSGINGGLVAIITGGGEIGINSCVAVSEKLKNGITPTQQEIKTAVQDASKQLDVEKIMVDNINQQVATIQNKPSNTQEQQITPPTQENVSNQNVVANSQDRNKRLQELKSIDTSNMGFIERGKIKTEIRALEQGFNSIEEYQKAEQIKREQAQKEYEQRQKEKELEKIGQQQQLEKEIQESNPIKRAQYEIIQKTNPMLDDYHTGIRSPKDIKTFNEVINDEESFAWGDFSKEDAQNALEQGKITIYSSYPIENGTFVSTSKVQAEDYAGGKGKKVYSKEVPLGEVAWINGDEGQYAKVDNLANNSKKVYNIINKSLTKNERAQVASEVRRWRINQEDGIGYIDLSDQGYKSYIYNKNGSNVETLLKVNGSEEFRNFIRKGIEDGTYKKSTDINGWASNAKLQYKNNSNVNDVLPNRGNSQTISGLYDTTSGQQTGNNRTETIEQSSGNESVKNSNQSSFNLPQKEEVNLPTKGEEINWNKIERPEGKFRKHYQSIIESSNTTAEAKAIAKEMMGTDTYVPESNQSLIQKADSRISNTNPDTELNSLYSRVMNNEKVTDIDIAVGERLIEYYSKIGDKEHLADAIHATAMAGTQAGRTVQAFALLNHMTPQGQVVWLQRSIDKVNNELQQKYRNKKNIPQFELTQEMTDKILNTNSEKEMFETLDEVYKELGQQVPKSMSEKIDEWRYFSMLANLKTHGRNMIGNIAMHITQRAKDKVAGAIEGVVSKFNPEMERTHTIVPTSKTVKEFAKNDVKNMDVQTQLEMNENKYNPQSRLQNARKTFKHEVFNKTLGELYNLNSKLLGVEDNIGLKSMYVKALGEYITANKFDINNMTDAQLAKARQHAIKEAKEATFHQASSLATALNQMGRKSNIKKFALDAVVPFKKTPINVAKTGVQYSPVGLIKSAVYDTVQLRKGNITINEYINNISKGLTGTGIAYLGYALAEAGILKASGGDDDRKEKYDEQQGKQTYSLEIGGKTYSLDWLSPVGIPLFIGVETNQQFNQAKKEKNTKSSDDDELISKILKSVTNIANGMSNAMNPMSEMSMVSGLTSTLSSYNKENAVGDMLVNAGKSYVNQFVPTSLGQLARTTDDYERTTKSTKTGTLEKAFDSTVNQIKSKIPGLRQTLPVKTDTWGKEVKQSENLPFRAFNNFINPSKIQDVSNDKVDKELNSLYARTKESSIIPKAIEKTLSINGTDYRMTNDEYADYSKKFGNTAYNLLSNLVDSKEYKALDDKQKQKAIESVYSYANEANKVDYAKKVKEEVKTDYLYNTMKALGNYKSQSQFLNYVAKTTGMDKESEKNKVLLDSDIDNTAKAIIYANTMGKDDKVFNIAQNTMNTNQYLEYKVRSSNDEFKADKDKNGNSISGSAKKKIYNYINSNISGYENRLIMMASQYKLSRAEQQKVVDYINKNSKTNEEVMEKLEKLSQNFQVKGGKVYFK